MAQNSIFRGTARSISSNELGTINFKYHNTPVVSKFTDGNIMLNSGGHHGTGYHTVTTKRAINQALSELNVDASVFQKDFIWYLKYRGENYLFSDNMMLSDCK